MEYLFKIEHFVFLSPVLYHLGTTTVADTTTTAIDTTTTVVDTTTTNCICPSDAGVRVKRDARNGKRGSRNKKSKRKSRNGFLNFARRKGRQDEDTTDSTLIGMISHKMSMRNNFWSQVILYTKFGILHKKIQLSSSYLEKKKLAGRNPKI